MLVNKLCVDVLLLKLCRLHSHKSFQSNYYVYYDLNNSALDFFIQFYRNCFLNSKLVLVVKVQTFYVNTSCSILNWTKSQIEANSDCPERNGRDINHLVCLKVGILTAFQKLQSLYVGGVNMIQFSCYLYTQG